MTTHDIPFIDDLRAELVAAASRLLQRRQRRRRRLVVATAAAALVLATTSATVLLPQLRGGAPALAISSFEDSYVVEILDAATDPARMNRQLAEAGIDAMVVMEPTGPELVGHVLHATAAQQQVSIDGDEVRIPASAPDVVLVVGRPQLAGEQVTTAGEAFAPGGTLYCSGVHLLAPSQAGEELVRRGHQVLWQDVATGRTSPQTPPDDWVIVSANLAGTEGYALVGVAAPGTARHAEPGIPIQRCGD